jgi:protein-tyrosine phosphatase
LELFQLQIHRAVFMKKVLFICTGNYYRSRFAEAWFNFRKGPGLEDWRAFSRGLRVDLAPGLISPHTLDVIREYGIPESAYQPEPVALKLADLAAADCVVAMKRDEHFPMMQQRFPDWAQRIRYWEVHDLDVWMPDQTLPAIVIQVGLLFSELAQPTA